MGVAESGTIHTAELDIDARLTSATYSMKPLAVEVGYRPGGTAALVMGVNTLTS